MSKKKSLIGAELGSGEEVGSGEEIEVGSGAGYANNVIVLKDWSGSGTLQWGLITLGKNGWYFNNECLAMNRGMPENPCVSAGGDCVTDVGQAFSCKDGVKGGPAIITPKAGQAGWLCKPQEQSDNRPHSINVNYNIRTLENSYVCSDISPVPPGPGPAPPPPSSDCAKNPAFKGHPCSNDSKGDGTNGSPQFPDPSTEDGRFFYENILRHGEFKISSQGPGDTCNANPDGERYDGTVLYYSFDLDCSNGWPGDPGFQQKVQLNSPQVSVCVSNELGNPPSFPVYSSDASFPGCGNNNSRYKYLTAIASGLIDTTPNGVRDAVWATAFPTVKNVWAPVDHFHITPNVFEGHKFWEIWFYDGQDSAGQDIKRYLTWYTGDHPFNEPQLSPWQCDFSLTETSIGQFFHQNAATTFCFHNHGNGRIYLQALDFRYIDQVMPGGTEPNACTVASNPPDLGFYCGTGLDLTWGVVSHTQQSWPNVAKLAGVWVGKQNGGAHTGKFDVVQIPPFYGDDAEQKEMEYNNVMHYCCLAGT